MGLAHDGVYRFEVPGRTVSEFSLTGASRLDVGLRCLQGGSVFVMGNDVVATVEEVSGDLWPIASPYTLTGSTWKSWRPPYLESLMNVEESVLNKQNITITRNSINGKGFNASCSMGKWKERVNEWWLTDLSIHPFHLHIYPQQVVVDSCGESFDRGEFYDTIHNKGGCKVRFRVNFPAHRVMFHCHHLQHEDAGAMSWINQDLQNISNSITSQPCCQIGRHCSTPCKRIPIDY